MNTETKAASLSRCEGQETGKLLNRFLAVLCFCFGTAFAIPDVWLCVRGSLPPIPIGNTAFVPIEGVGINGVPVGKWAYGGSVAGLFVTAFALYFAGWRAAKRRARNDGGET